MLVNVNGDEVNLASMEEEREKIKKSGVPVLKVKREDPLFYEKMDYTLDNPSYTMEEFMEAFPDHVQ